jgi:hypothetical protein
MKLHIGDAKPCSVIRNVVRDRCVQQLWGPMYGPMYGPNMGPIWAQTWAQYGPQIDLKWAQMGPNLGPSGPRLGQWAQRGPPSRADPPGGPNTCVLMGSYFINLIKPKDRTRNKLFEKLVWAMFLFFTCPIRDLRLQLGRTHRELSTNKESPDRSLTAIPVE